MKSPIPLFLRDPDPLSFASSLWYGSSPAHARLGRRDLAPGTMAILVIMPIVAAFLLIGSVVLYFLRRRRQRALHQNSPTTSMIRNSLEEDIEAYRRERASGIVGAAGGVSQEDLEHQLRAGAARDRDSMMSMTSTNSGYGSNSRSGSRVRGEMDGWQAPPAPHSPRRGSRGSRPNSWGPNGGANGNGTGRRRGRGPPGSRGPSRPTSRPASCLRNSIHQIDEGDPDAEKKSENSATSTSNIQQIDESESEGQMTDSVTDKEPKAGSDPNVKVVTLNATERVADPSDESQDSKDGKAHATAGKRSSAEGKSSNTTEKETNGDEKAGR